MDRCGGCDKCVSLWAGVGHMQVSGIPGNLNVNGQNPAPEGIQQLPVKPSLQTLSLGPVTPVQPNDPELDLQDGDH